MTQTMEPTARELRAAELAQLVTALEDQRTRAIDVVVPASKLQVVTGAVQLAGIEPQVGEDGVTNVDGFYQPTPIGVEGLAQKFKIPLDYLRRCQRDEVSLFDANVTTWMGKSDKSYLLRLLTHHDGPSLDGSAGLMRAFLSSRYRCIDNFDVLLAALDGLREAGVGEPIIEADLTDRRMVVRVTTPEIGARAQSLLTGYRNPFDQRALRGYTARELAARTEKHPEDMVYAGLVISNSETGNGSFAITPRLVIRICSNGQTITADALSNVHVGGAMDDGVIKWSDDTLRANLQLVTKQTRDAVATFLAREYVEQKVEAIEAKAGVEVEKPETVIATVAKRLGFSETEKTSILANFVRGGQMTAGGVMHAVTATAQTLDAERAWDLERQALDVLDVVAAVAK